MGLTVTITDNDDGTFLVNQSGDEQAGGDLTADPSMMAGDDESAEPTPDAETGAGEEQGSPEGQTVNSLAEALKVAKALFTNDTQVEDANEGGEDQNSMLNSKDAKSAWNDEATKKAQSRQLFGH